MPASFSANIDGNSSTITITLGQQLLDSVVLTKQCLEVNFTASLFGALKQWAQKNRESQRRVKTSESSDIVKQLCRKSNPNIGSYTEQQVLNFCYHWQRNSGPDNKFLNLMTCLKLFKSTLDGVSVYFLLELMALTSTQCSARHHDTLYQIFRSAWSILNKDSVASQTTDCLSGLKSKIQEYIDQRKDKAFHTAFIVPTEIAYHSFGHFITRDDVNVHGVNIYLSLIEQGLGITGPTPAFAMDDVKGAYQYLDPEALRPEVYQFIQGYLSDPKQFGKSVNTQDMPLPSYYSHRSSNGSENDPRAKYNEIVSKFYDFGPRAGDAARRMLQIEPVSTFKYLELYIRYFREDSLLTLEFWNYLYQSEFKGALGHIYREYVKRVVMEGVDEIVDELDDTHKMAIWIHDGDSYTFNPYKFKLVLIYLGVAKSQ